MHYFLRCTVQDLFKVRYYTKSTPNVLFNQKKAFWLTLARKNNLK